MAAQETSESLEYLLRQQGKVKTPKTLVKVVRAHTRELKRATRREHEKVQVEALSGIAREAIRGFSEVGKGLAEAHGRAASAWLGNVNPITWAAGGVAMVAYLSWLTLMLKDTAVKLGLPQLANMIPTVTTITKETILETLDDTFIGRPSPDPTPPPSPTATVVQVYYEVQTNGDSMFFDNQAAAEQAFAIRQLGLFGFALLQGKHVVLYKTTVTVFSDGRTDHTSQVLKSWP